jgi:hypothetical protein
MVSSLDASGSICCVWLMDVFWPVEVLAVGDFVVDTDINQASVGARSTSISRTTSP